MVKRGIFIILAGIITSAAVLGWCPKSESALTVPESGVPDAEKTETAAVFTTPSYHQNIVDLLNANEALVGAELMTVAVDDAVRSLMKPAEQNKVVLASPDVVPLIDMQSVKGRGYPDALAAIVANEALNQAKQLAIVDLKSGRVLASGNPDSVARLVSEIQKSGKLNEGLKYRSENAQTTQAVWKCLDESSEKCVVAELPVRVDLPDAIRCEAAMKEFMVYQGRVLDAVSIFGASDCTLDAAVQAVREALAESRNASGSVMVNGAEYEFEKSKLDSGAEIVSYLEKQVKAQEPVDEPAVTVMKQFPFSLMAMGIAGAAGLLVIFIGFACTRRKEEEVPHTVKRIKSEEVMSISHEDDRKTQELQRENTRLKEDCARVEKERDDFSSQVLQLKTDIEEANRRSVELNEQLEVAQNAFKKEQLTRMSLADENRRLEDALVAAGSSHTVVDNLSNIARSSSISNLSVASVPADSALSHGNVNEKKTEDVRDSDSNRVTAPAKDVVELGEKDKSQAFFDALSDDGWEEIAESFDAIFSAGQSANKAVKDAEGVEDNSRDQSYGITGFLNFMTDEDKRQEPAPKKVRPDSAVRDTSKGFATVDTSNTTSRQIPNIQLQRGGSENNSMRRNTLFGIASYDEPTRTSKAFLTGGSSESPNTTSLSSGPKPADDKSNLFWPTAPTATAAAKDQTPDTNSLFNALKRRARDVSEMDLEAVEQLPSSSGAFQAKKGLSKSGVFSVTGSRVDIDPLADNEYFKSLYEKYIDTQRACGESTDKFTLDQFMSRLAREKDRLIKTYHCKSVKFNVYVKDGKASLKATPQK